MVEGGILFFSVCRMSLLLLCIYDTTLKGFVSLIYWLQRPLKMSSHTSHTRKKVHSHQSAMIFTFGNQTAALSLRYLRYERAQIQISCSVPKCEWHNTRHKFSPFNAISGGSGGHLPALNCFSSHIFYKECYK